MSIGVARQALTSGSSPTFAALTVTGLLDLSGAGAGQIKFPASPNLSADVHTIDAYEEGTWTPTISAATVGNLAVTYSIQNARYTRIGNAVLIDCVVTTSAFTWTTASGTVRIAGLPLTCSATYEGHCAVGYGGYTNATYPAHLVGQINTSSTIMLLLQSNSAQVIANSNIADFPSAGTPQFRFSGSYGV